MIKLLIFSLFYGFVFTSCVSTITINIQDSSNSINQQDKAPTTVNINSNNGYKNIEKTIVLSYTDTNSDLATSCIISNTVNLTETTSCSCDKGECSVGITGLTNYAGPASFSYTVTANQVTSNSSTVSFSIIALGASQSDEWVKINENSGGMGLGEFYIMKYEAKAWNDANSNSEIDINEVDPNGMSVPLGTHTPVSIASDQPWREINANDAASKCESLGPNYHLVSNAEWMAIAIDIENIDTNWTGQSVGSGCLFRGNTGETTVGSGSNITDSCGYNGNDPEEGTARDIRARHLVSSGQYIFDLAGNIWEWVDWDSSQVGFQIGPTDCPFSGIEQIPSVTCNSLAQADYNSSNGSYDATHGFGVFYGGPGGAALRGSYWVDASSVGILALNLFYDPPSTNYDAGFRCVYRP